jgi:VanZ family protein
MQISHLTKLLMWLWLLAILYLSLKPQVEIPFSFEYMDKLLHIVAYGLATIMVLLAYPNANQKINAILLFSYGLSIEIAQLFAENRYFEVADLLANLSGIVLSYYLFNFWHERYRSNNEYSN